jgi:hypothetical protein
LNFVEPKIYDEVDILCLAGRAMYRAGVGATQVVFDPESVQDLDHEERDTQTVGIRRRHGTSSGSGP